MASSPAGWWSGIAPPCRKRIPQADAIERSRVVPIDGEERQ
jgi:hypothetical protein